MAQTAAPTLPPVLVPELAVCNWAVSRRFYCDLLGFSEKYSRPEEGFSYLQLGGADLMIDEIGKTRSWALKDAPFEYPLGRGLNLQIQVPDVAPLVAALKNAGTELFLPLEDKWYRDGAVEYGSRQFITPDPDGYLLRFFQDIGTRPWQG